MAEAVRSKAAAARLEATDEAKRMNQMVLYSKCMAIRRVRPSLLLACRPALQRSPQCCNKEVTLSCRLQGLCFAVSILQKLDVVKGLHCAK